MKKKITISSLDKKLWKVFARYIKLRDSKQCGDKRIGYCITCKKEIIVQTEIDGKIHTNGMAQAGHFLSRKYKPIKYEEKQVNLQCGGYCNNKNRGNGMPVEYEKILTERHGKKWVENLKKKALDTTGMRDKFWTDKNWYREKIEEYKEKIKKLENPDPKYTINDLNFL